MRRTMVNMTQSELASHLDLTFQQLQKYESGSNRISAGVLYKIANALQVDLNFFFLQEPSAYLMLAEEEQHYQTDKVKNNKIDKLVRLYIQLPTEKARKTLLQFIEAMVE